MKSSNVILIWFIVGIVSVTSFFVFENPAAAQLPPSMPSADAQQVLLSEKNFNYYPSTIRVKAGQPVSITLDESVKGCLRAFTIKSLGVEKYARTAKDTIDFTPQRPGTYQFSCSMGMGYGTLVVEPA